MGSNTIPFALVFCKMLRKSPPLVCDGATKIAHKLKMKSYGSEFSQVVHSFISMNRGSIAAAGGVKGTGPGEEQHTALEIVLKLHEAIKDKNVNELSEIIAEECSCSSNFVSAFQPFCGKKQVLEFFTSLMINLGNNLEFVVQPTSEDGMVVGVSWKLEWNKVPLSLGKGFGFYMCHVYRGKVMIKNVEIFMEPLLHIEPLRLRVFSLAMTAMEKLNPQALFKNKARRAMSVLFLVLLVAAILLLLKYRNRIST